MGNMRFKKGGKCKIWDMGNEKHEGETEKWTMRAVGETRTNKTREVRNMKWEVGNMICEKWEMWEIGNVAKEKHEN